jgi:hypothetical protein
LLIPVRFSRTGLRRRRGRHSHRRRSGLRRAAHTSAGDRRTVFGKDGHLRLYVEKRLVIPGGIHGRRDGSVPPNAPRAAPITVVPVAVIAVVPVAVAPIVVRPVVTLMGETRAGRRVMRRRMRMTRMHGPRRLRCGMMGCGMSCGMGRSRMMRGRMLRSGVMRGGMVGRAVMRAARMVTVPARVPVAAVGKARRLSQKSSTHRDGQSDQVQALHFHLPFGLPAHINKPGRPKGECGICPKLAKICETQNPKST